MEPSEDGASAVARRCLEDGVAVLTGEAVERRHEALMEWAEADLGLEREYAEQVYALAGEEELEPIYAFLLVRCGIGVRELEEPAQDGEDEAAQKTPPGWVKPDSVELDDIVLERRLRASFRRLRGHLTSSPSAGAAVAAFLAEPDVDAIPLR
ncbi:MAG TPA: hypothetical protein VK936_09890 [Longimicrobiales bacterium]|nr:hypothetical protein [Longimicrobiales bacterium]